MSVPFLMWPFSFSFLRFFRRKTGACKAVALAIVALLMAAIAPALQAQDRHVSAAANRRAADALVVPATARASISAAIGRDLRAYHFVAQPGGFATRKAQHGLSAAFTPSGPEFRVGANRFTLAFGGYGYGARLQSAPAVRPQANANRVEYHRGALAEWYVDGPLGIEQGFTLARRPGNSHGQALTIALKLSGNLQASLDTGGYSLNLKKDKVAVLRYTGLIAMDKAGRRLNAWIEVAENRVAIRVNDARAQYPLTIDPLVQVAVLSASDAPSGNGSIGASIAMSSDGSTIVAVDPGGTGAAYVFVEPSGGWSDATETAKLTASDGDVLTCAAISRDGSTIALGASDAAVGANVGQGAAYVFVKPSSGWTSATEDAKLLASDGGQFDIFGRSVSVDGNGDTIAVGAPSANATYVFVKPVTGWASSSPINETKRVDGPTTDAYFGAAVALSADGNTLASGAPFANSSEGEVGVYFTATRWLSFSTDAQLTASDANPSSGIYEVGFTLAISADGGTILAGAPQEIDVQTAINPKGAAYVFVKPPTGWASATETAKLNPSDGGPSPYYSFWVAISDDGGTVLLGDPYDNNTGNDVTYVFVKPIASWATETETAKLHWGWGDVAVNSDGTLFVISSELGNGGSGAIYIFTGSPLTGTASLSTSNLTFADQHAGTTSASSQVTLTNTGRGPLNVTGVVASANFTTTQNCVANSPLAVGAHCTEDVAFAPGTVGAFTGTLTFTDDSAGVAGAMQTVQLSGTGVRATTSASITSISPDPALVNQPVSVSFSVYPEANDTLTPTGSVTVSANTGESCTATIAAGSCNLTFSTAGDRNLTASYGGNTIFSGSTSTAVTVSVIDFSVTATPDSETISSGHMGSYTLTITALNGLTGTISLGCVGGPPQSICSVSPASVFVSGGTSAADATVTLSTPRNANHGTFTITFTAAYGGATRTYDVTLTVK